MIMVSSIALKSIQTYVDLLNCAGSLVQCPKMETLHNAHTYCTPTQGDTHTHSQSQSGKK